MEDKGPQSLDLLGVKPIAEAVNTAVKGSFEGASAFLSRICLPAAEEFGLLLRDHFTHWRANHAARIAQKAERVLKETQRSEGMRAHPRLVAAVLEQGSWSDKDHVQEMWAGLLASSCTEDGGDDSNIIFVNLLSQLTGAEAIFLNSLCSDIGKEVSPGGTIRAERTYFALQNIMRVLEVAELYHAHRYLNHLASLNLVEFYLPEVLDATVSINTPDKPIMVEGLPTPLALYLYVRCKGFVGSPIEYFGLEKAPKRG
jgi:hypothetical protein